MKFLTIFSFTIQKITKRWLNAELPDNNITDNNTSQISHNNSEGSGHTTTAAGPFGRAGSNDVCFSSQQWLQDNGLTRLVGVVFYYGVYLEGIQFEGVKEDHHGDCQGI